MVSAEQRPSISATLFLCWVCQGRTFESAPPDHKTLVAAFSKMPPKMERNMWKNALWVSKVTQYFCEVSRLRRSGLREYLLSNRLLMSELKLNPKLALKCTHFWTSCSKVPQRRVACFFFFLRPWPVYLRYLWPLILTQLLPFSRLLLKPPSDFCHCPLREATWLPKCRWSSWT